ncbi:liver-expressed antimicrobial peptide 2 [Lepisosteus oculatus]|uniref:liver-expressed antimicrobial peptide 2 n=1 Tax=Lepisosteus oculatus TaxID=7918 RepID=UPI00073FFE6D|nr:PREDICTED: liver-expressed antimicrobial peptide 2-like [Lepisosteus oculatus]
MMRTLLSKIFAVTLIMSLLCGIQVQAAPLEEGEIRGAYELVHRAKRSMLWRWITLRPVGASCRDHSECGTNFCKNQSCAFRVYSS